jgi:hypothetical protein
MRRTRPLRCKCCNQPITKEPVKVCVLCEKPILRGHKWQFTKRGVRHRHCAAPDSYLSDAEYIAANGQAMFDRMRSSAAQFARRR